MNRGKEKIVLVASIILLVKGIYILIIDGFKESYKLAIPIIGFAAAILVLLYFKRKKAAFDPTVKLQPILKSMRKGRGVIRIGDKFPDLAECSSIYEGDYNGKQFPDSVEPDGSGQILTFKNVGYGAMCTWMFIFASPDAKGWFTMGDLSQDSALKELSNQDVMLFIPAKNWDSESVYLVTPDGKCYRQEISSRGALLPAPDIHQSYQDVAASPDQPKDE